MEHYMAWEKVSDKNQFNIPKPNIPMEPVPQNKQPWLPQDLGAIPRLLGQTAARGTESVLGLLGDVPRLGSDIYRLISGGRSAPFQQTPQEWEQLKQALPQEYQQNFPELQQYPGITGQLPGKQEFRQATQAATGQSLEPKSGLENQWGTLVEGAAPFLIGGGIPSWGQVGRALASSGMNQLASWAIEQLPEKKVGKQGKFALNVLTPFLTSAITSQVGGRQQLNEIMEKNYDTFGKKIEGQTYIPKKTVQKIDNFIEELGSPTFPGGQIVKTTAQNLKKNINKRTPDLTVPEKVSPILNEFGQPIKTPGYKIKGQLQDVPLSQLWEEKKNINAELKRPKYQKPEFYRAKRELTELNNIITSDLKQIADKKIPGSSQFLSTADELFYGQQLNNGMHKWLEESSNLKKMFKNPWVYLGVTGAAHSVGLPGIVKAAAGVTAGRGLNKWISFINQSPTAAQYYKKMYTDFAKGNLASAARMGKKLDQAGTKFENKQQKSTWVKVQ